MNKIVLTVVILVLMALAIWGLGPLLLATHLPAVAIYGVNALIVLCAIAGIARVWGLWTD